jgi:uncharacterized membrane protein (DUF485 family)
MTGRRKGHRKFPKRSCLKQRLPFAMPSSHGLLALLIVCIFLLLYARPWLRLFIRCCAFDFGQI